MKPVYQLSVNKELTASRAAARGGQRETRRGEQQPNAGEREGGLSRDLFSASLSNGEWPKWGSVLPRRKVTYAHSPHTHTDPVCASGAHCSLHVWHVTTDSLVWVIFIAAVIQMKKCVTVAGYWRKKTCLLLWIITYLPVHTCQYSVEKFTQRHTVYVEVWV